MKVSSLALAVGLLASVSAGSAYADIIPYPNAGTVNSVNYTFTAASTGTIEAYFYGASAGFTEVIGVSVNGAAVGVFGLNNQTSNVGDHITLANVTAGDTLVFVDKIISGSSDIWYSYSSSASQVNVDGIQHAYSTSFSGLASPYIPAGTYVSFEDLPQGQSDLDYNDVQFVFTNTLTAVPEPSTWAMMLLGFGGLAFAGYRARKTSVSIA